MVMQEPTSHYGCGNDGCEPCYGDKEWQESQQKYKIKERDYSRWTVYFIDKKDVEHAIDTFASEEEAEFAREDYLHCDHDNEITQEWNSMDEAKLTCQTCMQSTFVNIDWSEQEWDLI
jgi:peptide subunit release factor 1 (eRF1)